MNYYAPENASFLLPFQYNPSALEDDLKKCKNFNFLKNYVPENYDGDDYILPLRSIGGNLDFPVAVPHKAQHYKNTPALDVCPYFKSIIDSFLCEKEAIRLMNLPAGRVINTHTDYKCGYEDGIFRVHIPIITNKDVHFILNNVRLHMNPGAAWYTNVNLPHSVANKGKTNRIHLVMDCIRNEWSNGMFKSLGYDFTQEKEVEPEIPREAIPQIIEELERQNLPASAALIEKLKKQINN